MKVDVARVENWYPYKEESIESKSTDLILVGDRFSKDG